MAKHGSTAAAQDEIDSQIKADIPTQAALSGSSLEFKNSDNSAKFSADLSSLPGLSANDFTDDYKSHVDDLWSDYQTALTLIGGDS